MKRTRILSTLALPAAAVIALSACSGSGSSTMASPSSATSSTLAPAQQLDSQSLPSFLPSTTPGGLATGTAKQPAISYQGVPVKVVLDQGAAVKVNVLGPVTPPGTKAGAEAADCSWTIEFSGATKSIPLSAAQLNIQDGTGAFHKLTAVSGTTIPTSIPAGRTVRLSVHSVVPSGEGMVRWAPDGTHVVAMWDYIAELD